MDSFRELQEIYEGYRGHSTQPASRSFPAVQGKHSYKGPLPGSTPGGQGPIMSTIPSIDEEAVSINKKAVTSKIKTLIDVSHQEGSNPKHLIELLSYINKL